MPALFIRADGGASIGSGHICRCLAIARQAEAHGMTVRFLVSTEDSKGVVTAGGFEVVVLLGEMRAVACLPMCDMTATQDCERSLRWLWANPPGQVLLGLSSFVGRESEVCFIHIYPNIYGQQVVVRRVLCSWFTLIQSINYQDWFTGDCASGPKKGGLPR